jgi:ABC-2 type transport system ATP-binding protein
MRVRGPDVARLAERLRADGATVSGDGDLLVGGRTGEQIGRLVAEHQLVISELTPVGASLEEVFLRLTQSGGRGPA